MSYELIGVELPPQVDGGQSALFVPSWAVSGTSNVNGYRGLEFPHINIPLIAHQVHEFIAPTSYLWRMSDYNNVAGVTGQGAAVVANPASLFANHALVKVGFNNYYDPSYGAIHVGQQSIDNVFNAFGVAYGLALLPKIKIDEGAVNLDLDGDLVVTFGKEVETPAIIIKPNPGGLQVVFSYGNVVR